MKKEKKKHNILAVLGPTHDGGSSESEESREQDTR